MILLIKKSNLTLIILVFLLSLAVYSLNIGSDEATPASSVNVRATVIVDAGHGGEDPGAVSDYSGVTEKEINLIIASKLKQQLEESGYKVILTRSDDSLVYKEGTTDIVQKRKQDLLRRKEIMDNYGADIVVSIHLNKFGQTKYYGTQTFYPPNSPESQRLAINIQKLAREVLDTENKREALIKKEPIIIFRDIKTPSVVVECGFLSNEEEERKLRDNTYQDKIAQAIKLGIDSYFSTKAENTQ